MALFVCEVCDYVQNTNSVLSDYDLTLDRTKYPHLTLMDMDGFGDDDIDISTLGEQAIMRLGFSRFPNGIKRKEQPLFICKKCNEGVGDEESVLATDEEQFIASCSERRLLTDDGRHKNIDIVKDYSYPHGVTFKPKELSDRGKTMLSYMMASYIHSGGSFGGDSKHPCPFVPDLKYVKEKQTEEQKSEALRKAEEKRLRKQKRKNNATTNIQS